MGKIPSKAGESISMKKAKELIENFQKKCKVKNKSMYYSRDVFQRLLDLPDSAGIRVYPGLEDDSFTPVLVAVDKNGDNIYIHPLKASSLGEEDSSSSLIEERGGACPPYCPSNDFF